MWAAEAGAERGANWRWGKKSELGPAIESGQQGLKRGPGYVPLTPGAIRLVPFFECGAFENERLHDRSTIHCGGGRLLCVVHCRTALDHATGRVKRPRDWMAQGREVLTIWEFN